MDCKAYYVFGTDQSTCDFVLPDASCSSNHAALVWHENDVLYVIDLRSAGGTRLDGDQLPSHKPTRVSNGSVLQFGPCALLYKVEGEHIRERSGSKRRMDSQGSVGARHLLVKHRDVRNPRSWKEAQVTRSKDEALQMIQAYREQLVSGAVRFENLASSESHCSSARKGGDLGTFSHGQMQPAFEHAAFALKVGELSQPVFSDSGVHLIYRYA